MQRPDRLTTDPLQATTQAAPAQPWPRILLVEDNTEHADNITAALAAHFHAAATTVANTGGQALRLDTTQFDAVLLNVDLPDCSGLDVLNHIMAQHDLPVLMVTHYCDGDTVAAAIRSGASDYIVKQGGYLTVLPILLEKTLVMAELKEHNLRLQRELKHRNEQLEQLNAKLAATNRLLRQMADRDPLTSLSNRRCFDELLEQRCAEARRYGYGLACMMIDIDNFKQINDTLGHQAGDHVLLLLAGILREQLRAADLPARYGGDEFAVLLPHSTAMDACTLARRIAQTFKHQISRIVPDPLNASLSIGIEALPDPTASSGSRLLSAADDALLRAKQSGKGRVVLATESALAVNP